jgi:Flp pilus assembly protein TadD
VNRQDASATRPRERLVRRAWFRAVGALIALVTVAGLVAFAVRPKADPQALWDEAKADFDQGRYAQADAKLDRVFRLRTPNGWDWMLRAQVSMALGRIDEAIAELDRVPDDHPMASQAWLEKGQLALRSDRAREAEQALRHAIALDPKLPQPHRELIYILGMQLRRGELAAEFEALSSIASLTFQNVFTWCLTRGVVWDPTGVREVLSKFVAADPDDRQSRLALAECLRQLNRFDDVEATLAPLPASDPEARAIRIRVALDRGDAAAAEALLAEGPEDHPALARYRGRLALMRGDIPGALRHLRAAYAVQPDDRDTVFLLGNALTQSGDADAARPFLEAAKDYDRLSTLVQRAAVPGAARDPDLQRALGAACEAVGRLPEARAWYKLAIGLEPLNPEGQRALYRVEVNLARAKPKL